MQWQKLPVEIQERMLNEQLKQGNPKKESVFIYNSFAPKEEKGFNWGESVEKEYFWEEILLRHNIDTFFKIYPKDILPKKWCIKLYNQSVVDYCNVHGKMPLYKINSEHYAHFPPYSEGCTTAYVVKEGYTEITLNQFKEDILKQAAMQQLTRKTLLKAYNQFPCNTWSVEVLKLINQCPLAEDDTLLDIPQSTLDLINQSASTEQQNYIKTLGIKLVQDKNAFSVIKSGELQNFSEKYLGGKNVLNIGCDSVENFRPDLRNRCLIVDENYTVNLIECPNGRTAIEILKK